MENCRKPKYMGRLTKYYKKKLFEYLTCNIKKTPEENIKKIHLAYNVAFAAHKGQNRKGGLKEPYITHPVEVAIIASKEMGYGTTTVISALLHDVLEDSELFDKEYIEKRFGEKVLRIVEGVTKIAKISGENSTEQMDTFTKMILTIPQDYRVLIIKIADRLHNMRTMEEMPEATKIVKSAENLYLYAKVAEMIGLWHIKLEVEDRSFENLQPNTYKELVEYSQKYDFGIIRRTKCFQIELQQVLINYNIKRRLENYIDEYKSLFGNVDLKYEIITVKRSFYKVWTKMWQKKLNYDKVHNHFSTRIIFDINFKMNRHFAYAIFWLIADAFQFREKSIKDWIVKPKKNGFRALVFDVIYVYNKQVTVQEIQIMSKDDHEIAQFGYLKKDDEKPGIDKITKSLENNTKEDNEIIEIFGDIIKTDTIYINSPKGDIYEMPKNSTVLDFAFRLHTEMGLKCYGAHINESSNLIKRDAVLGSTQIVKILTSDKVVPTEKWLDFLVTSRARTALKNYLKKSGQIIEFISEGENLPEGFHYKKPFKISESTFFEIAPCCQPALGEESMVFINEHGVPIVHKRGCSQVQEYLATKAKRTAIVQWEKIDFKYAELYTILIKGKDRVGILRDIADVITNELKINMNKIFIENTEDGLFNGYIELYAINKAVFNQIIFNLKKIDNIDLVKEK